MYDNEVNIQGVRFSTEVEKTKIRFFNLSFENNKICALDITYKPSGFTTITYY